MFKLQCFSYFLQFLEAPEFSAFKYSAGSFSSADDDGLDVGDGRFEQNSFQVSSKLTLK